MNTIKNAYERFFLLSLISVFLILFCCKREEKRESSVESENIWYTEFSAGNVLFRSSPEKLFVFTDKSEIYSFSLTDGWKVRAVPLRFEEVADIVDEKTLITREGDVIVFEGDGQKKIDFPVDPLYPFYFVSSGSVIYYRDGKIFLYESGKNQEIVIAESVSVPKKVLGVITKGRAIAFWISDNIAYWKDIFSGKAGIVGEGYYEEKVNFYFSPDENAFVAYTSENEFGDIDAGSVRLYLRGSDFRDFSFEVRGRQIILKIKNLPPNQDFSVKYKIIPRKGSQVFLDVVGDGENLLFADMELVSEVGGEKFCSAYAGDFDGESFRRKFKFSGLIRGCNIKVAFSYPVSVFSIPDEFSNTSTIFFGIFSFWNREDKKGLIYPVLLKGFPYIIYFKRVDGKYQLELEKIF